MTDPTPVPTQGERCPTCRSLGREPTRYAHRHATKAPCPGEPDCRGGTECPDPWHTEQPAGAPERVRWLLHHALGCGDDCTEDHWQMYVEGEQILASLQTEIEQLRRERKAVHDLHRRTYADWQDAQVALREATSRAERAEAALRELAKHYGVPDEHVQAALDARPADEVLAPYRRATLSPTPEAEDAEWRERLRQAGDDIMALGTTPEAQEDS